LSVFLLKDDLRRSAMHAVMFVVANVSRKERISLALCQAINADRDDVRYVSYRNLPVSPAHKAAMTCRHHLTSRHARRCCKVTKKMTRPCHLGTQPMFIIWMTCDKGSSLSSFLDDFMMMCYQLFYVGDEISDFKDKRYSQGVWGKMGNAYRFLVVETDGKGSLEIALADGR